MFGRQTCLLLLAALSTVHAYIPQNSLSRRRLTLSRTATRTTRRTVPLAIRGQSLLWLAAAKQENDDNDDDASPKPGMEEAFRQLEALESLNDLDDDDEIPQTNKNNGPLVKKIDASALDPAEIAAKDGGTFSPEKEIQVYSSMVEELEQNEDAQAYSELLDDLGSKPKQTDDTYSQVIMDLGGSPVKATAPKEPEQPVKSTTPEISLQDNASTEQFMEDAMAQAMKEVKINNPNLSDSILDDKEIMEEIEEIFEQGNAKLMASLEEIRLEQQALAQASAAKTAQAAVDGIEDDAVRLRNAEESKKVIMGKVAKETAIIEQAMAELQQQGDDIDSSLLIKLKRGGLPKQGALVGLVLFSVRSIIDSIAALSGDETHIIAALVQGAIAIVCALVFVFL